MHVVYRESHGLEETETPFDVGQDPADLVVMSFSDSDLGAFAAGWHRSRGGGRGGLPSLRLVNLVALKHPLSVDTYVEKTLAGAKGILIRLIGGAGYWAYGLASVQDHCRKHGIALAVLPADGRPDPALAAASTVPASTLSRLNALCDAGGAVAAQAALAQLALAAGLYAGPVAGDKSVPDVGAYDPARGVVALPERADLVVVFYRSYLTAGDTGPIDALLAQIAERGLSAAAIFVPSPRAAVAVDYLRQALTQLFPRAIINATAFSARGEDGSTPFDGAGVPVFQVALSTARRKDWLKAARGLSPADLAMHVVLPEVDGRIFAGLVSFKQPTKRDPDLQFSRFAHRADHGRIAAVLDRVQGWLSLQGKARAQRKLAFVLSTYPGRADQMAHAVGLDTIASVQAMAGQLAGAGYDITSPDALAETLGASRVSFALQDYITALALLPEKLRDDLGRAWGAPQDDPLCQDGAFHFTARQAGSALIALQPERGEVADRDGIYHDLSRTPRHSYVAFYLMLRAEGFDALLHIGAHGTLEWLPGKSVAQSECCWPEALIGPMPVIYPFIVNDPGEAAQAKRRIGAVTLGHLPPPLKAANTPDGLSRLERLLDEYSTADGLDPARRDRLIGAIRDEARATGVEADLGLPEDASMAEAITRIDRFVCDIKESQYGDGLHIWGQGAGEWDGLMAALDGRFVPAGPSGSPYRGRSDVVPTGRNLYSVDPRAVPSRAAHAQGVKLAEELLRRHLQDNGDWPRGLVLDLWGSATMRTAGEEVAMALHLAGLAPTWDGASERVTGFEILPLAMLGRPRIDVTLRISGLFRDVFPSLSQLFEAGADALSQRDESPDDNPYLSRAPRVFGPKPGLYGMAMGESLEDYSDAGRMAAGEAWLQASSWAVTAGGEVVEARDALEARVLAADAFAHVQDLAETDVLMAPDYAAHEGGVMAAKLALGGVAPALYHLDSANPDAPRARVLSEEIGRVVRARAANPYWVAGMMRHGFRGGAELAATLDNLGAFAHLTRSVPAQLFDLYYDATLGRDAVVDFLTRENPAALAAMRGRFAALQAAGLWITRRNSIAAALGGGA